MKNLLNTSFLSRLYAFDNGTPGWKMDGDKIAMKDGNPIYIDSSGREMTVGGDTISTLNKEAKTLREAKEDVENKLKLFEGIDPEIARKSIDTVKKIDAKKLIDSGEVDKLKDQIKSEFTGQLSEAQKQNETLQGRINDMLVSDIFKSSEFVRESVAVPRDMFEATFRSNFKIEDGKIVAYDKAGNRLMSKQRVGEYPDPNEALQLLVEAHPQKDIIMRAPTGNGSGSDGGGGVRGQGRTIKRSDFAKLSPAQQADTSKKVKAGEMTLTD